MAQKDPYTVASLVANLKWMRDSVEKYVSEHLNGKKPTQDSPSPSDRGTSNTPVQNAGNGSDLDFEYLLVDMASVIDKCLTTWQSEPAVICAEKEGAPVKAGTGAGKTAADAQEEEVAVEAMPAILQTCVDEIEVLIASQPSKAMSTDSLFRTRARLVRLHRSIVNGCSWTHTQGGALLYLSLLPADLPSGFQELDLPPCEIRRWQAVTRSQSQGGKVDESSYYLSLLNASFNDREPQEYHREKVFVEHRREAVPDYAKAATDWIPHAHASWSVLRPQVFSLFNNAKSFNFVQWTLEYARQSWPALFGLDAESAGPQIELTNALCTGTVTPLHVAASLGLPGLCEDLISSGSSIDMDGPLGTPLLCALLGGDCFKDRLTSKIWDCPREPAFGAANRAKTILTLLDAGANWRVSYAPADGVDASPLFLFVWVAFDTQNVELLRRVDPRVEDFDFALEDMLQFPEISFETPEEQKFLARLLTYLFDVYMRAISADLIMLDLEASFNRVIEEVVRHHNLEFPVTGSEPSPLTDISDNKFYNLAELIVLQSHEFDLRRLAAEPRFDPNLPGDDGLEATLLHIAVSADNHEMVEILIPAGADLKAWDNCSRPPILLVESTSMLETLLNHGASIADEDKDGRTIWHYAAASNDVNLVAWLCENDPDKDENLVKVSKKGCTPLADSFLLIEDLADQEINIRSPVFPIVARKLLKECKNHEYLQSSEPLTHLAAAWGDIGLVNGLEALGADFEELDEDGRSVLHHLNFSATPALVERLQELCHWEPPSPPDGLHHVSTPAETMFANFEPVSLDGITTFRSAHPSCRSPLSEDTFTQLLTPASLESLDSVGNCLWQRFCRTLVSEKILLTGPRRAEESIGFIESVTVALKCLIKAGAMHKYEDALALPGVACFLVNEEDAELGIISWPIDAWHVEMCHAFIQMALENGRPHLVKELYASRMGMCLLLQASVTGQMDLEKYLFDNGVTTFDPSPETYEEGYRGPLSPFEWVTGYCGDLVTFGRWIKQVTAEQINRGRSRILHSLVDKPDGRLQDGKLTLLLEKGLDLAPEPYRYNTDLSFVDDEKEGKSLLAMAIWSGYGELATSMLRLGADPRAKSGGKNAAVYAAEVGNVCALREIIKSYGADFPWSQMYGTDAHGKGEGILNTAIKQDQAEVLEILLEETNIAETANKDNLWRGLTLATTDAALGHGSTRCLEVLLKRGVDLIEEEPGYAIPLHYAGYVIVEALESDILEEYKVRLLSLLARSEPRALEVKDHRGQTGMDYFDTLLERFPDEALGFADVKREPREPGP